MKTYLKEPDKNVRSLDCVSAYPSMDVDPFWLRYYGMPMGVVLSKLNKYRISCDIGTKFAKNFHEIIEVEKVISSTIGVFYFRKGGKHNSWLCYKYID